MRTIAIISALALVGCATPEQARQQAGVTSSYTLCSKLANAVLAPSDVREVWAQELARRGENCGQYMGTIQAEQAKDAQINQLAQQLSQPRQPSRSLSVQQPGPAGFLKRTVPAGAVKYCVYDKAGSQVVTTIQAVEICPLSN